MKTTVLSGAAVASAAAALILSGAAMAPAAAKTAKSVHCSGINGCKGMGACKTASNSCKGQNACKGQGWVDAKSQKACEAKGGTVVE